MDGLRSIICVLVGGAGLTCLPASAASARANQPDFGTAVRRVETTTEDKKDDPIVPKTARLYAEGRGDLSYKATRDGYVYIVDHRDEKMVYEGPIDAGETILVAPFRNVIEIDGKRVKRVKDLDNKHIHHIYFERDSDVGRSKKERDRQRRDR